MELNNNYQSVGFLYQQLSKEKDITSSVDKNDKSTFEKLDNVDVSNNKNTQRDEESKKIENTVSSMPNLNNAKEELSKNNNLNKLERMKVETTIFRIYKFSTNNFIVFDQPRSILKLRNLLSKIFNFQFSLNKKTLNLDSFVKNNLESINHISKIDAREIIHPNNIFEKKILYTQSFDNDLFDFFGKKLTAKSYKIFKIDLFFNDMPTVKITISYDFKFVFSKIDHDNFLLFLMKSQNNIESLKINFN